MRGIAAGAVEVREDDVRLIDCPTDHKLMFVWGESVGHDVLSLAFRCSQRLIRLSSIALVAAELPASASPRGASCVKAVSSCRLGSGPSDLGMRLPASVPCVDRVDVQVRGTPSRGGSLAYRAASYGGGRLRVQTGRSVST